MVLRHGENVLIISDGPLMDTGGVLIIGDDRQIYFDGVLIIGAGVFKSGDGDLLSGNVALISGDGDEDGARSISLGNWFSKGFIFCLCILVTCTEV